MRMVVYMKQSRTWKVHGVHWNVLLTRPTIPSFWACSSLWCYGIPVVYRWCWRWQCVSWCYWTFFTTWQYWNMQWCMYYTVIAVRLDVQQVQRYCCVDYDPSYNRFWVFIPLWPPWWATSFNSMPSITIIPRSCMLWSCLLLPCLMWDDSFTCLMGNQGRYITNAIRNLDSVYVQCLENQFCCCIDGFLF